MRIAAAQMQPIRGDIEANTEKHLELIQLTAPHRTELILFSELSLTGYEPSMAGELAVENPENITRPIVELCRQLQTAVGVGLPMKTSELPTISCLILSAEGMQSRISKHYLHEDELPFFSPASKAAPMWQEVGLAICYEMSVAQHVCSCTEAGAQLYAASVAKTIGGLDRAHHRMQKISRDFSIPTLMSNCIGMSEEGICGGRSAAWNAHGEKLAELDQDHEGVLLFNTETEEVVCQYL